MLTGEVQGCEAQFTPEPEEHDPGVDSLSFSIELSCTDRGGSNGEPPLTARQGLQFELLPR